jgi:replicative DNA helicase Mcm
LLVGDPGIAKSQMMMRVVELSQRGVLVHGSGASKAGLTASAVNDGQKWVLDAGALVMADKGLCAVDEFEKMVKEDRGSIHSAMEQQVVAINKAGINTVLNCRCSLVAAANPKLGRFDLYKSVSGQFEFDPALLSRFDLIYPMMDIPDKIRDGAIIDHMCKVTDGKLEDPPISTELFRKYIAHAKKIVPRMSKEADDLIKGYWSRQRDQYKDDVISINYRHMYSLHRLSEAAARLRLSDVVTSDDARLAISLVDEYLRKIAYDVKIGKIDVDRMSRVPKSVRNGMDKMTIAIHNCSDDFGMAHIVNVEKYMKDHFGVSEKETQETLEIMKNETMLFMPRPTLVKMMDRK